MTRDFLSLLKLLRFGVFGIENEVDEDMDLEAVLQLALKQGVLPIVYGSLSKEQKKGLNPKWEQLFFRAMVKNEQKMVALASIIKKLEEEKIEYCILKGCTVAKEYHLSECRLSGDIDLYVKPESENKVYELLKSMGLELEERPEGKQDFKASGPTVGLIEVHVFLYAKVFRRDVLKNKFGITEKFCDVSVNDFLTVKGLGLNDTLDFLTTHFIKHLVREGSGIRQITDLLAFVVNHKDEIDFKGYFERLEELKFKKLIMNVFGIGVKYFNLNIDEYLLDNVEELLNDVESAENFGYGEVERLGFYERFLVKRMENEGGAKKAVSQKQKSVFKAVFLPGRSYLIKKGYTYLGKSILFYPVAYAHRLWDVMISVVTRKRKVKNALGFANTENETINMRLKMMRDLDII